MKLIEDDKHLNSFNVAIELSNDDVLNLINILSEASLRGVDNNIQLSINLDYLHRRNDKYKVSISTLFAYIEFSKIGAIVGGRAICDQLEEAI